MLEHTHEHGDGGGGLVKLYTEGESHYLVTCAGGY